jgi:hypothetical protein
MGHSKDCAKGKVYSYKCLHLKKNRGLPNKQSNDIPEAPGITRTNQQKKRNNKVQDQD